MKDVFIDIIVPLLAAFIGGGMTLFGVKQTIRHENELRQEDYRRSLKMNAKPLLINRGFYDEKNNEPTTHFLFTESGKREHGHSLIGVFKSTDVGIVILDKIQSGEVIYLPVNGKMSMIDKNTVVKIEIVLADKKETLGEMQLLVSDIYGNPYRYTMEYNTADLRSSQLVLTSLSEIT